jgi:hypothetical protein
MLFKKVLTALLLACSLAAFAGCANRPTNLHPVSGTDEGNEIFKDRGPAGSGD